jgi:hypothetical protein
VQIAVLNCARSDTLKAKEVTFNVAVNSDVYILNNVMWCKSEADAGKENYP